MLYVNHRVEQTKVLGPGLRYALWLQGCLKRCPGCLYPEGRALHENGYDIAEEEILRELKANPKLTGITVSGGEPFLQAVALAQLIKLIKRDTKLDIMLYSGYTLAELQARQDPATNYILAQSDILVDGEYCEELNGNELYRGSANQVIHFLSGKYRPYRKLIEQSHNRSVEFVYEKGELFVIGVPAKNFDRDFWQAVAERESSKK